jgi:hypothetical protein
MNKCCLVSVYMYIVGGLDRCSFRTGYHTQVPGISRYICIVYCVNLLLLFVASSISVIEHISRSPKDRSALRVEYLNRLENFDEDTFNIQCVGDCIFLEGLSEGARRR